MPTLSTMGRAKDPVHKDITIKSGDQNRCVCNHCHTELSYKNVTMVKKHMMVSCKKIPAERKVELAGKAASPGSSLSPRASTSYTPIAEHAQSTLSGAKRDCPEPDTVSQQDQLQDERRGSSIMAPFVAKLSNAAQQKFEKQIAKFVYSGGLPARAVENKHLIEAVKTVHPAAKLPSRKMIHGKLLDDEYGDVTTAMNAQIDKAQVLTLSTDGWTKKGGHSLYAVVVLTPEPFYIDCKEWGAEQHTAKNIYEFLKPYIQKYDQPKGKVAGFVSDTEATMGCLGAFVTADFPHIIWIPCGSHVLHLLAKDILNDVEDVKIVVDDALEVSKYFKSVHLAQGILEAKQVEVYKITKALDLPGATRWNSHVCPLGSWVCVI